MTEKNKHDESIAWAEERIQERLEGVKDKELAHSDPEIVKLRLYKFFQKLLSVQLISRVFAKDDQEPMLREIVEIVRKERGDKFLAEYVVGRMRTFMLPAQEKDKRYTIPIKSDVCQAIYEAVPRTKRFQDSVRIKRLWNEHASAGTVLNPHIYKRFNRTGHATKYKGCNLRGDYLLFRADSAGEVSPAFFRFYEHETGGVRTLGLRLEQALYSRLSSKGWAVRQKGGYLVTSYIVDRGLENGVPTIEYDGGTSLLHVNVDSKMFYQDEPWDKQEAGYSEGSIERVVTMAPIFHVQATYEDVPSVSHGIIVRLKGVEHLGGQRSYDDISDPEELKQRRNIDTMELQTLLSEKFGISHKIQDVGAVLSKVTGIPTAFFNKQTMKGRVHTGRGLFNNRPIHNRKKDRFQPMTPRLGNRHYNDFVDVDERIKPNASIFIDFENPPKKLLKKS